LWAPLSVELQAESLATTKHEATSDDRATAPEMRDYEKDAGVGQKIGAEIERTTCLKTNPMDNWTPKSLESFTNMGRSDLAAESSAPAMGMCWHVGKAHIRLNHDILFFGRFHRKYSPKSKVRTITGFSPWHDSRHCSCIRLMQRLVRRGHVLSDI
jgi:hypothetical protein